jgi:hypothetical protein
MVYSSDNENFLEELMGDYKLTVYYVYYYIKLIYSPAKIDNLLSGVGNPVHTKIAKLTLLYLNKINELVATALGLENSLEDNATIVDVYTFLDLPPNIEVDRTILWGNHYWKFLHQTSILYSIRKDDVKFSDAFRAVLYNLLIILPCPMCMENFQSKLITSGVMENKVFSLMETDPIRAVYDLHSLVNEHTNPIKYKDYTFETFLMAYGLKIDD